MKSRTKMFAYSKIGINLEAIYGKVRKIYLVNRKRVPLFLSGTFTEMLCRYEKRPNPLVVKAANFKAIGWEKLRSENEGIVPINFIFECIITNKSDLTTDDIAAVSIVQSPSQRVSK